MRDTLGENHEALFIDSTFFLAHRHSAGTRPAESEQAIRVPRGGRGTKVHALCDGLGYLVAVELTDAQ